MCVCHSSTPPFVFIGGSHRVSCSRASSNRHQQPMGDLHMEPERGLAHLYVGRPAWSAEPPVGQSTLLFGLWVISWAHLLMARGLASVALVSCSGGPFTPYSDTCRVLVRRNIVSWIKPHHYAAKLAQNHLHTF